jgi:hypothetical protein
MPMYIVCFSEHDINIPLRDHERTPYVWGYEVEAADVYQAVEIGRQRLREDLGGDFVPASIAAAPLSPHTESAIPHGQLKERAIATSLRLIDESQHGETSGEDVARALGLDLGDQPKVMQLYHALFAAKDEGLLRCDFPGGMGLPYRIRR